MRLRISAEVVVAEDMVGAGGGGGGEFLFDCLKENKVQKLLVCFLCWIGTAFTSQDFVRLQIILL